MISVVVVDDEHLVRSASPHCSPRMPRSPWLAQRVTGRQPWRSYGESVPMLSSWISGCPFETESAPPQPSLRIRR